MKKYIYILVIIFLGYGKGFADSNVTFRLDSIDATDHIFNPTGKLTSSINAEFTFYEHQLCKKPTRRCIDYSFPMNSDSTKHKKCAELFVNNKNMKTYGITTIYYTSTDSYKTVKKTSKSTKFYDSQESPINTTFERLQNLNEEDYFSDPIFVPYFKGFGLQISI